VTTETVDPFAAAQVQAPKAASPVATGGKPVGTVQADPFTSAHDTDDPFATSSDFRGGDFVPSPPLEILRGRLLAMFPRAFDPEAENRFKDQGGPATRELYTVDLYVLDGGPLKFPYKKKGNPEATDPAEREDKYLEWDAGDPSPAEPFVITRFWVPQGNLIGKLKQAHAKGAPFLGVLDLVPQKAGRDKGETPAKIRAEYDAWIARNRVGNSPRIAWAFDEPTPERRALGPQFWAAHKANIAPINTATAPPSGR
jgi:hypothetical protein